MPPNQPTRIDGARIDFAKRCRSVYLAEAHEASITAPTAGRALFREILLYYNPGSTKSLMLSLNSGHPTQYPATQPTGPNAIAGAWGKGGEARKIHQDGGEGPAHSTARLLGGPLEPRGRVGRGDLQRS